MHLFAAFFAKWDMSIFFIRSHYLFSVWKKRFHNKEAFKNGPDPHTNEELKRLKLDCQKISQISVNGSSDLRFFYP